ncbi:Spore germination protein B1 [Bacillus sp. THAF10]|uniref:spore germination protein n=1 Tax=Bacillus sp. THAF10 TaxID=2587848 RepID=UPI00126804E0|nr:spore germination protein [Bacillus sp. THAF10]QFT89041.1 Spore germination protein B1 [Bacillus sp. THAF10]
MNSLLREVKDTLGENDDFFMETYMFNHFPVILIGLKSLIDLPKTLDGIRSYADHLEDFPEKLISLGEKKSERKDVIQLILEGKLILAIENEHFVISVEPYSFTLNRSIDQPINESIIQGSLSSFIEDLNTNIGLIRKHVKSEGLHVKNYSFGSNRKGLSLVYVDQHVDPNLITTLMKKLDINKDRDIQTIQDIIKLLNLKTWSVVAQINTTELPQEASHSLKRGKVLLLVDRLPFAIVLPSSIWDMFILESDRNFSVPIMLTIRFIRIVGILMTLIVPGLYVALVAVNPEVLRIELVLSIAQSREGVPYPSIVEMIIMLIILELIVEASVRLPKSIGPTITMVGGIILGQAAVEAKLVSNLIIIILAATTIANSTIIGFQNILSIRLLKYLVLILAAFYGVLGILVGLFLICSYLASIKTFGIPYINFQLSKGDSRSG